MAITPAPLRDVAGLSIGHWSDLEARTGCTVIAFDQPALTAVEVRGAAPGTRELDLLAPGRTVQRADAIFLTGGSAFGLWAAEGVVQELRDRGRGYPTPAGPVPIVPGAVIYDLSNGTPLTPSPEAGREALVSAKPVSEAAQGVVGAGVGAQWGAIAGHPRSGGLGIGQIAVDSHLVTAIVVLNAFGVLREQADDVRADVVAGAPISIGHGESTTLISVITTMPCDHGALTRLCVAAHDGLARAVVPSHTVFDGDVAFASTLVEGAIDTMSSLRLGLAVELAVESAISAAGRSVR